MNCSNFPVWKRPFFSCSVPAIQRSHHPCRASGSSSWGPLRGRITRVRNMVKVWKVGSKSWNTVYRKESWLVQWIPAAPIKHHKTIVTSPINPNAPGFSSCISTTWLGWYQEARGFDTRFLVIISKTCRDISGWMINHLTCKRHHRWCFKGTATEFLNISWWWIIIEQYDAARWMVERLRVVDEIICCFVFPMTSGVRLVRY